MPGPHAGTELRRKLLWLIALRAAIVTALLGSAILVRLHTIAEPGTPFFGLIGVTYGLTALYALTLKHVGRRPWLVDVQFAGDAVTVSAITYLTGGVTSYFPSLYVLPIVAASVVQSRRGGFMVAGLGAVSYAWVVAAQYAAVPGLVPAVGAVEPALLPPGRVAVFNVATNIFGFLAVAALSGYLAESLRRAGARLARASSEIADLQAFSQHVIDSLTSGLATTDEERRILTFNRAAEIITGHGAGAAVGRPVAEVLQLPPSFEGRLEREVEQRRPPRIDFVFTRPDGARIDLGLSAAPLITSSGPSGHLFTFQDLTDIKKLEREAHVQQRLAAVGEMAAGIAHEIRNPLASMSGSIQILRQELPLTDEQRQLMDIVLRESERLNETIRSFLAYARPQRFATTTLDLRGVITDTAVLLRHSAEFGEGHQVDVRLPDTAIRYDADEGQIRQILWNLATNGLRAMPDGGRLTFAASAEHGGVCLSVSDEGMGIPPEELDALFQPFRGTFAQGTGLGLAIVHRIVSDYGGEIQVTSEPGAGTTVRVHLPANAPAAMLKSA
jgi:two-component system sensor histidine kinase PilS (NtrC family)